MGTLANSAAQLGLELPNSREAETEADQVGLKLSAEAGFNPEAAVTLWEKMAQYSSSRTPGWLSTHPDPGSRINTMRMEAEQLKPIYEAAKASKPDHTGSN
jgi:predicted Zn-dependent protease